VSTPDLDKELDALGQALAPRASAAPAIMARVADISWQPPARRAAPQGIPLFKPLLWLLVAASALISLFSLAAWLNPNRHGIENAGGVEMIFALDARSLTVGIAADELARRTVEVLKRRVDPAGRKNIVWRVAEGPRIVIQVPYASAQARLAHTARADAEAALDKVLWKQSEIESVAGQAALAPSPAQRTALLEKFIAEKTSSPADPAARSALEKARTDGLALLETLTGARQKLDAASAKLEGVKPTDWRVDDLDARNSAQAKYYDALKSVLAQSVDLHYLANLITAADSEKDPTARKDLAALPQRYPLQQSEILAFIAACKADSAQNAGLSPEDIQRLVTARGILDFRIAVLPGEAAADLPDAERTLRERGPETPVRANGTQARWFALERHAADYLTRGNFVIAYRDSTPHVLLYDDHDRMLTHSDPKRKPWTLTVQRPYNEPGTGGLTLPFRLDRVGAAYMGDLTASFKAHPLAILLDDKVLSAPTIQSQINDAGVITFGTPSPAHPLTAIQKEAGQLQQMLAAGPLPAPLERQPLSVTDLPAMPNLRISPWPALGTFAPLPVLVVALWMALRASWPRQPPIPAFDGPNPS
jgi:SecD/SecF fusion protein